MNFRRRIAKHKYTEPPQINLHTFIENLNPTLNAVKSQSVDANEKAFGYKHLLYQHNRGAAVVRVNSKTHFSLSR